MICHLFVVLVGGFSIQTLSLGGLIDALEAMPNRSAGKINSLAS
jgi:hypothetical protein